MYLGSWKIDDLLTFPCNTHTAATGAATDADSVPSYRVYEDETGTAILSGSMAKLDDANTTGFYSEQITLSAANGFEKGKCYTIYISAAVSSVTGTMSHTLQMEAEVDANRVNWANVDNPSTTVGLSGTTVKTATDVETDTQDIQARLPAALGANGNIKADVRDYSGTAGTFSGGRPEVNTSHAAGTAWGSGAITAASIATDAITAAKIAADAVTEIQSGLSTLTAAGVRTAVGLASANLDTQLDALPTNAELSTALGTADDATLAAIAALNNISTAQVNSEVDTALADVGLTTTITGRIDAAVSTRSTPAQILTTALTEAYATDGAAGTLSQILFGLQAFLQERAVSGTTLTVKKLDGSTTAMTFTLNDATTPTSVTRSG